MGRDRASEEDSGQKKYGVLANNRAGLYIGNSEARRVRLPW